MAYIEENLKIRSKPREDSDDEDRGPPDPQEALYRLADRWKVDKQQPTPDEGSVTNSLTMLTAIPEVDLGMEWVLCPLWPICQVIISTQTARGSRILKKLKRLNESWPKKDKTDGNQTTTRNILPHHDVLFSMPLKLYSFNTFTVYRPNLRTKSDSDILRDAKLEAMGMPPQDDLPRRSNQERTQMATDEMVPHHLRTCIFGV